VPDDRSHDCSRLRRRYPAARGRTGYARSAIAGAAGVREGLRGPITKPITKPLTVGEGAAPGPPCKCMPLAPKFCLTTRPPRLRRKFGWSGSPSGLAEHQQGEPGAAAAGQGAQQLWGSRWGRATTKHGGQDQARTGGTWSWSAPRRQVIAFAIDPTPRAVVAGDGVSTSRGRGSARTRHGGCGGVGDARPAVDVARVACPAFARLGRSRSGCAWGSGR
jgi:hypothetical protein